MLVTRLGDTVLEEFAATKTLGLGGCCFVSNESVGAGSILEMLISVDQKVVKPKARVIYENQLESERFEVGVEFLDLAEGDKEVLQNLFDQDEPAE